MEYLKDFIILSTYPENRHLKDGEIVIGITNFSYFCQEVTPIIEIEGTVYIRRHTEEVPRHVAGDVCSAQLYERYVNKTYGDVDQYNNP